MTVHQPFAMERDTYGHSRVRRRGLSKKTIRLILCAELFALDIAALALGPLIATNFLAALGLARDDFFAIAAIIPVFAVIAVSRHAYSFDALAHASDSVRKAMTAFGMSVFMVLVVAFFLKSGADISRLNFGAGVALSAVLMAVGRSYFPRHARHMAAGSLLNELLIIHGKPMRFAEDGALVLDADHIRLRPDLNDPEMLNYFGALVEMFDRVVIDSQPEHHRAWALLLKGANVQGEILLDDADEVGAIGKRSFQGSDSLIVSREPLSLPDRMKKRVLDLGFTIPLLILMSPFLAIVAIAIKLDTPGPVLFMQDRVGRGNRLFKVFKFRSMRTELCDSRGNRSASRDDDRITRVGRVIRALSIDELPQLFNVLLGDMSLVGPRPHALGSLAGDRLFWQIDEKYWLRHQLKPGITGLAQVRGYRGATLETTDLTDRLQSDMEYIQGWRIWRDVVILANTVRVVAHRNAF